MANINAIIATLGLEIDATGATRALRDVDTATGRTTKNVRELQQLLRALGLAWGIYEVVQFTKETIALADAYKTMGSRLALVTHDAENLAEIQRTLFRIAQDSRTPLESVSLLYERLARVSGELGLEQQEVLRHTETINKAMVISGTSAEGTRAALVQLSQGFAAGTLRGDELNAVLEQAPRLAQAIADGMGVSVGQLRRMGAEGKLTADAIVKALEDQADAIDREFSGMEMTVGGAMTRLRNAWMSYVGEADEASGATAGIAEAINSLADAIEPVGNMVNAFFGGFSLLAVDAAINVRKLQHTMVNLLPEWMTSDSFIATAKKMPGPFGASFGAAVGNVSHMRGLDRETFFAELEAYRAEEEARITGATARASGRVYGAGLTGDDGATGTGPTERQIKAYQDLRQEMQYAREDLEQETRDLQRSTLERAYAANAIEHERRVREIVTETLPQYHAELIKESEALMGAANAHASREQRLERENDLLAALVDADREFTAQIIAQEEERRRALEIPFENAIENIQRGWGDLFHEILSDGRVTADTLGGLFRRAAAETLAGVAIARSARAVRGWFEDDDPSLGNTMNREAGKGAFAGAAVGYGLGRMTESAGGGAIGGALGGAAMGAMVGGPIGAAAGAITGLIGGIFGAGQAAEEASRRMDDYRRSIEAMEASLSGDVLGQGIARVRAEMEQVRRQLDDAVGGMAAGYIDAAYQNYLDGKITEQQLLAGLQQIGGEYAEELLRIHALEGDRIEQLREEYALQLQRTSEDLDVRALRAQGRDDEADALALRHQQQRERDELVKSFGEEVDATEAALLAHLDYVQGLELTADAMNGLNRSAANLPATFKMAGYVFDAMQDMTADAYRRAVFGGGPSTMPSAPPSQIPSMPVAGSGGNEPLAVAPVVLQLNDQVLAKAVLKVFKRATSGPGSEQTSAVLGDIRLN